MDMPIQILAFLVVCICQYVCQEDVARRSPQNYATVNKKLKNKNFVQLGRKRIKAQGGNIEKFEIMRTTNPCGLFCLQKHQLMQSSNIKNIGCRLWDHRVQMRPITTRGQPSLVVSKYDDLCT